MPNDNNNNIIIIIIDNDDNNDGCPSVPKKTFPFQQITDEFGGDSVTPVWGHTVGSNGRTGSWLSPLVLLCVDGF